MRLTRANEVEDEDETTTRHLSWSVNIFFDFIHAFIHSFGGVC